MFIKELHPGHFGKFHNLDIELAPGINVIYGKNEAGKSTLHGFIKGMLFGIERARGRAKKEDTYTKYQPWETPGAYQGSMVVTIDGEDYRFIRSFYKNEKSVQIIKENSGRELPNTDLGIGAILPNLTESIYRNTISIEQLRAMTEYDLAEELKNYITNLTMTKSKEVDVNGALSYLSDKKKAIEKQLPSDRILELKQEIIAGQLAVSEIEEMNIRYEELKQRTDYLHGKMKEYKQTSYQDKMDKIAYLPVIKEKFTHYLEMMEIIFATREKLELLCKKGKKNMSELDSSTVIQDHLREIEQMKKEKQRIEEELRCRKQEQEPKQRTRGVRVGVIGVLLILCGILITVIPLGYTLLRYSIGFGLILLGGGRWIYEAKQKEKYKQTIEDIEKDSERKLFVLHSQLHDVLLDHRVSNEAQLIAKYNEIVIHEVERTQSMDRKAEYQLIVTDYTAKAEQLELEIINFMTYFVDNPVVNKEKMQELEEIAKEYREKVMQEKTNCEEEYKSISSQLERLKWTLEANADKELKLVSDQKTQEELLAKQKELSFEIEAISLSYQTLKELSSGIHDSFGSVLNEMLSKIVSIITQGEYSTITVDEHLNVQVLHKEKYVALEKLSAGTMDQIYLSLRLAVADLLFPEQEMPVLLDDTFALYDDERIKAALSMLSKESSRQIIIFTCHRREKEVLEELKIDFHYVDMNLFGKSKKVLSST